MNFINQLLKHLIKERCILHLKTIFGVSIWLICSYWVNLIRDLDFYYVIDIFSKYAWVVNAFQTILKESNRKPNKIWVDEGSESYNNSFKKWLKANDIEMHSTNNEEKSVLAEIFIRTLKNKLWL